MFYSTAKVDPADLPGCGIVEMFFIPSNGAGVEIKSDWNGFGMRSTESQSLHYQDAAAEGFIGYPDFLAKAQPLPLWYTLFAAVPSVALEPSSPSSAPPRPTRPPSACGSPRHSCATKPPKPMFSRSPESGGRPPAPPTPPVSPRQDVRRPGDDEARC